MIVVNLESFKILNFHNFIINFDGFMKFESELFETNMNPVA